MFSKTRPLPRVQLGPFSPHGTDLTRLTRLLSQRLIEFALVEEPFFRLELPSVYHPDLLAISAIYAEDSRSAAGNAQVEKPGLRVEPRGIRQ